MENKLQIFSNPEFGKVRTIEEDGKVLFCGKDVAVALGYSNPRKATSDHCKGVMKRDTLTQRGVQTMNFIPEGDVYRLIVRSRLPAAEKFERWLFDEVVPSVVKTGSYHNPQMAAPQMDMAIISEIITKTASAVATEIVKQLLPVLKGIMEPQEAPAPKVSYDLMELFGEDSLNKTKCKLEYAPAHIREPVDAMFKHMMRMQRLNFSVIARFCKENDFSISNPAVRRYYDRVICDKTYD